MPSTVVRPIGYEDRLSIVDHLDELRTRIIICLAAFVVCFGIAYWQNNAILKVVNKPFTEAKKLDANSSTSSAKKKGALAETVQFDRNLRAALDAGVVTARANNEVLKALAASGKVTPALAASLRRSDAALKALVERSRDVSRSVPDSTPLPVTLGVTEPFITTFTVAAYAALLLALPVILFQLYAFLLPAFSPQERKMAVPFMCMVPVLFLCGVAFGYFVALPRAVDFLLNFNSDKFDILVGAQQYYKFSIVLLLAVGLLFQIPVAVLAVTRLGILTPKQLSKNRGYIILAVSIIAAVATPTPDPITMLVTMAPLLVLFELSLILARITYKHVEGRPSRWDWDDDEGDEDDDPYGFGDPGPHDPADGMEPDEGPGDDARDPEPDVVASGLRSEPGGEDATPRPDRDV